MGLFVYGNGSQTGTLSNSLTYARGNNQIDGLIYDASGNVLSYNDATKGAMSYTYDAESQAASVSVGGTLAAKYVYDASGAPAAKLTSTDAVTANYVLGPGGVYAELDASDNIVHRDLYAGSALAASYDRSGALHLHLSDWLGTRRAQTDAAGVLQMTYASYPFGDGLTSIAAAVYSGDDSTETHFTGKDRDNESGLDYFGARYLASSMGRLTSPDPDSISRFLYPDDPQSWNGYAYARNNPLSYTDPTGEWYQVCDEHGQNCSQQSDKEFNQNKQDAQQQVEVRKNGNIYMKDDNGNLQVKGTYDQTDVDLPGAPEANRQAAAQIVNTFNSAMKEFGKNAACAAIGTIALRGLGVAAKAVGELDIFKNTKVVINWAHNLSAVRPGNIPPLGRAAEITSAVEGAVRIGNYTMKAGGLIEGTITIHGVTVGFRGRMIDGVARIATVFTKR